MTTNALPRRDECIQPDLTFELFVAGDNLYSARARATLDKLIEGIDEPYALRIVDVRSHPSEALARRVFATPSLVVTTGGRTRIVIGDMNVSTFDMRALFTNRAQRTLDQERPDEAS